MSKLRISDDLSLPLDAVTQAIGWLGRRGSGKSYGSTKLAELLYGAGAQFVALDPVGIWYGLRLSANGKDDGLDVPIFGGLHGDIPLEATAGALIADVIVDRGVSAVLDVSQFESDADKARFARDFAARFFFRKKASPSAVHVFIEEAQEFIPQNIQRGEEQMLHAFQRMVRLGRNYGIGVSMVTQRPQDVNKKALNQTECLFCFQLTGPQERKAVEDWVSDKGLREDLSRILPELKVGHAHVWSPVWLNINREVHIAAKETFAAGSTPKLGEKPVQTKPLAAIELEKIRKDMAATIEKAKAEDPKHLRAELAKARAELQKAQHAGPPKPETRIVEKPVVTDAQVKQVVGVAETLEREGRKQIEAAEALAKSGQELIRTAREFAAALGRAQAAPVPTLVSRPVHRTPEARVRPVATAQPSTSPDGITPRQRRFLDAAATLHALNSPVTRETVCAWIGVHPRGGSVGEELKALQDMGMIVVDRGAISVTDAGMAQAEQMDPAEAIERAKSGLSNRQARIFDIVAAAYPESISREAVAEQMQIHPRGGSFGEDIARLAGRGLIDSNRGSLRVRDFLYAAQG